MLIFRNIKNVHIEMHGEDIQKPRRWAVGWFLGPIKMRVQHLGTVSAQVSFSGFICSQY